MSRKVFSFGEALNIQPRSSCNAASARSPARLNGTLDYAIIHHSDNPGGCTTSDQCKRLIKNIQSDHKARRKFSDIGYNFIVGGDGEVYEGRGYGFQGAHAPGYNRNSIGTAPSAVMIQKAKELLEDSVQTGHLKADYSLLGHRQTKATACPGQMLYNEITTWPHWKSRV